MSGRSLGRKPVALDVLPETYLHHRAAEECEAVEPYPLRQPFKNEVLCDRSAACVVGMGAQSGASAIACIAYDPVGDG